MKFLAKQSFDKNFLKFLVTEQPFLLDKLEKISFLFVQ